MRDHLTRVGDLPSKFLFQRVHQRKQRSYIYMLKDSVGEWIDNEDDIAAMILNHFKELYSHKPSLDLHSQQHAEEIDLVLRELHLPRISAEQQQLLLAPFFTEEIKEVIFNISNDIPWARWLSS